VNVRACSETFRLRAGFARSGPPNWGAPNLGAPNLGAIAGHGLRLRGAAVFLACTHLSMGRIIRSNFGMRLRSNVRGKR